MTNFLKGTTGMETDVMFSTFSFGDQPNDELDYLYVKAPSGTVSINSARLVPEFARPFLTPVCKDDNSFKVVLTACHSIYYYLRRQDPPATELPSDIQSALESAANALKINWQELLEALKARHSLFESCHNRFNFPHHLGSALIPKDPPSLTLSDIKNAPVESLAKSGLGSEELKLAALEAGAALRELERYWDDEHARGTEYEAEMALKSIEDEFGRDFDPDLDLMIEHSEFDFEEWDTKVEECRDRVIELFFSWLSLNQATIGERDTVSAIDYRIVITELFRFCYQNISGEIVRISEMKREYLRLFIIDHLMCTVFQLPKGYLIWSPFLGLFFRFLDQAEYQKMTAKFEATMRGVSQELGTYLLRQFG